ncbi:glyoxylase-like metal-dependent hydrolase (beta-lactamase superfamily II)/rhodanese-related sulfurtransferase [Lewinella marina]|uniref:MBL fold metallo-hydrolase n=1 Tax=Neolewinella marina TaxID=438751 RepID=A0A2G0CGL6_9BACT|nr:MBL fold metallo-hydrolase [Neolewinella marina]NJB86418.1 glyoxylase-like metal-dependent hydrolase (beta-lactamase superfamily II)/rhodanese-related sulfurtransferase [Neolewinella marina]PHK99116.1 MBL fold metallo-hydrolase [Neolewinella marina]
MNIHQFFDDGLAHASYAIIVDGVAALVDPARDTGPYLDYLRQHDAKLEAIIETHPHADFVSSHLELHESLGAPIYVSGKVGAEYTHTAFDGGKEIKLGDHTLKALDTPGHSPDSISIVLSDASGKQLAVFTGDTLFVGDVGRPDLREGDGSEVKSQRKELARAMYHSLHDQLAKLDEDVKVYPAHGAGSLCGKGMSDERSSTLGKELRTNPAFQQESEEQFVDWLLADLPFVPKYFPYDVALNKRGAQALQEGLRKVQKLDRNFRPDEGAVIVDTRDEATFKQGYLPGALNIQNGGKFETWLGALVAPKTEFYLVAASEEALEDVIAKTTKIGYEYFIRGAFIMDAGQAGAQLDALDVDHFRAHPEEYTIVDVRNASELEQSGRKFESAVNIPLPELPERTNEIPRGKPVVVHCAGGFRSAVAASVVAADLNGDTRVLDLSEAVKDF